MANTSHIRKRRLWVALVFVLGVLVVSVAWFGRDTFAAWVMASRLEKAGVTCEVLDLTFDGSDATLAPTRCTMKEGAIESVTFTEPVAVKTKPSVIFEAKDMTVTLRKKEDNGPAEESEGGLGEELVKAFGATRTLTEVLVVLAKLNDNKVPAVYADTLVVDRDGKTVVEFSGFGLVQTDKKMEIYARESVLAKDENGTISIKKPKISLEGETAEVKGRVRLGTKVLVLTVAAEMEVVLRASGLKSSPSLSISAGL